MTLSTFLIVVCVALIAFAAGYLLQRGKAATLQGSLQSARDVLQSQLSAERAQAVQQRDDFATQKVALQQSFDRQLSDLKAQSEKRIADLKTQTEQQVADLKVQADQRLADEKAQSEKRIADLKAAHEQQLADLREQQRVQMKHQEALIAEQIKTTTEEMLRRRSQELSDTNRQQLGAILTPLQENLRQMREAVEKSDRAQSTTMARLDESIKANLQQAREVGERADKLAQALTAENKQQGNFGELQLRTLLQQMNLEEGVQFEEQVLVRDEHGRAVHETETGRRMIPDVILHFPDQRDVVIDAKMSLKAFLDYFEAKSPEEKTDAISRHTQSVRNHVHELVTKNYSSYVGKRGNRLDFVMMYVPNEGALQMALAHDRSLWQEAYNQGVVIAGPQSLAMMLRILEMSWRQMRQVENQDNIMKAANEMVSRVQIFYERFQMVKRRFDDTQKALTSLDNVASPGGQSILTSARKLLKYGAEEDKRHTKLPQADADNA